MSNIKQYKQIILSNLFEVRSPKVTSKNSVEAVVNGLFPYVTGSSSNNGVEFFLDSYTEKGNVITIDRITYGFIGYQENNFSCNDNVKILEPKFNMDKYMGLYISTLLRNEKYRYNYGRITSKERLDNMILNLPVNENLEIDWVYLSEYIKKIYTKVSNKISALPLKKSELSLDISKWKNYPLSELFYINGSKTTPLLELEELGIGEYPFVTTQATNNGVEGFYDYKTEKGNVLTIDSAVIGYCSYQPFDFSASDHVEKLIPKFEMDRYIALFISTILNKEQYRYNYGRKASQTRLKERTIKLPTKDGGVDWDFMRDYIKSLPYSSSLE